MTAPALAQRTSRRRRRPPVAPRHGWRAGPDRLGVRRPVRDPLRGLPGLPDPRVVRAELHELRAARPRRTRSGRPFVGLENYIDLLADAKFWKSLVNTVYFVVVGVPLTLAIGLADRERAEPRHHPVPDGVPGRLLPAGDHEHRGDRGGLAVPPQPGRRPDQHAPRQPSGSTVRPGSPTPPWRCRRSSRWPSGATSDSR